MCDLYISDNIIPNQKDLEYIIFCFKTDINPYVKLLTNIKLNKLCQTQTNLELELENAINEIKNKYQEKYGHYIRF